MRVVISLLVSVVLLLCCCAPVLALYNDDNIYYCQQNNEKKIALTFDDGPHPRYTERVLEILKRYNVKATFFVIGENIEYYPGIVEKIVAEGHEIGNHTYHHKHTKMISDKSFKDDVTRCDKKVLDACGYDVRLFRPPEGYVDKKVKEISDELGYSIILWNIDTKDWEHAAPSEIERNVIENISAGDIILMHDYISGKNSTLEALERIIPRLLSEQYQFVTVSELIKING